MCVSMTNGRSIRYDAQQASQIGSETTPNPTISIRNRKMKGIRGMLLSRINDGVATVPGYRLPVFRPCCGASSSSLAYACVRAFQSVLNPRRSDDEPRQRIRPTHSMVPGHWDNGVAKHNHIATSNNGSWLRPRQSRGLHTHEPPFYEVYPRLSDPPIDH